MVECKLVSVFRLLVPGGMCEWLKQAVLKTAVPERVPGVRIPLPPPRSLNCRGNRLFYLRNTRIMPVFRDYSLTNRTSENGLLRIEWVSVPAFLWRAHAQSGFKEGTRRMQCDHSQGIAGWGGRFSVHRNRPPVWLSFH